MLRVAIIGGYGNFGSYVAHSLAPNPDVQLIIAGRSLSRAQDFARKLSALNPVEAARYDLTGPQSALAELRPDLVINMVGPYNDQGYAVAESSISCGANYCDIADAREFVAGISELDEDARAAGVTAFAGASSVPALTAAYLDEAAKEMRAITRVQYGISGAEQANRGAGTVAAVLRYVGQRFTTLRGGEMREVIGWSDLHSVVYPELGRRWFGRGNVPDLSLFKGRYPTLREHTFWAGHEIALLHFGTALMGLLVRAGLLPRLDRLAGLLVGVSKWFNWLGRGRSGFHMFISGEDAKGGQVTRRHWIIARQGHGPYIPCVPVILLAEKMASGERFAHGARPCLGIISLDEYREAMKHLDITWIDE